MFIQSSTYVNFESSAMTMYFQYIHLPVCKCVSDQSVDIRSELGVIQLTSILS